VSVQSFANFSQAARARQEGGVTQETIDYSQVTLSSDVAALMEFGGRLAQVGKHVEQALGKPQDIEGVLVKERIVLVQARPQQGE
jgi:phosphoenolpyruvate synthase/pyruvate phosphate dikinase